jgi:hypothetical protein
LLYKLQRYVESDDQRNMDTLTTDTNKATQVYMLAAWKVKDSKPFVHVALVEHAKEFTWNGDKLKELYDKNCGWFKKHDNTSSSTWLVDDNNMILTTFRVRVLKENFELSISISEEKRDDNAMRPLYVDLKR